MGNEGGGGGVESLRQLTGATPAQFLYPSHTLSLSARTASQHLFSSLKPYASKSPFDRLLVEGFDAEQIWQQIDIQSQPIISSLARQIRKLEKTPPEEIRKMFGDVAEERKRGNKVVGEVREEKLGEFEDDDMDADGDDMDEDGDDVDEDGDDVDEDGDDVDEEEGGDGVEDKFFKRKELDSYLKEDERREYGMVKNKKDKKKRKGNDDDEEEDEDDDDLNLLGADMGDDEGEDELGNARYEDFYGPKKKFDQKRKPNLDDESEDSDMYGEEDDEKTIDSEDDDEKTSDSEDNNEKTIVNQKQNLSTHEIEQQKLRAKIEQMEKANLEPKHWSMQGEAVADSRPKNSALEVDLDFEHNVRPAPVITEEFTADIEKLIRNRILEGKFDDVQKLPSLQSKAPKEYKEMDENKSKEGLAKIYEDEFVQKTGLVSAALTFSDEQKNEASMLFKKLCMKLDALSHFHFTPKPVIADMSIQANVPALAMEEIAPVAVSDAAMLAPEEVYAGKGDIKEETELTQGEKKRRRANKKRKFQAETVRITGFKKRPESTKEKLKDGNEMNNKAPSQKELLARALALPSRT